MNSMPTPKDLNDAIYAWDPLGQAWREDPGFRRRLQADPTAAAAEKGLELPAGVREVRVAENTAETFHVIFPASPNQNLSDEALRQVSGGTTQEQYALWESLPWGPVYQSTK